MRLLVAVLLTDALDVPLRVAVIDIVELTE